jgi:hypothetical protein
MPGPKHDEPRHEATVAEAGRRGGTETLARKGKEFFRAIGSAGGKAGGSAGGKKGGARVRALVAAGKRALRREKKGQR